MNMGVNDFPSGTLSNLPYDPPGSPGSKDRRKKRKLARSNRKKGRK